MLVLAHAGHWLVSLAYLAPLAVLAAVVIAGRIQDRRSGRGARSGVQESADDTTAGPPGAKKDL